MAVVHAASSTCQSPYDSGVLSELTGGVLRPGGLDLTRQALIQCALAENERILDLGCGAGKTSSLLVDEFGLDVIALDPSPAMLAQTGKSAPQANRVQASAGTLPFRSQSFRAVICECVLSLTHNPGQTLMEISRVLQTEGYLVISDIYLRAGFLAPSLSSVQSCATRAMPLQHILALFYKAGLQIQTCQDYTQQLKQLAGEIIFSCGSLQTFWSLFLGQEQATATCCQLSKVQLGYYQIIARTGKYDG